MDAMEWDGVDGLSMQEFVGSSIAFTRDEDRLIAMPVSGAVTAVEVGDVFVETEPGYFELYADFAFEKQFERLEL